MLAETDNNNLKNTDSISWVEDVSMFRSVKVLSGKGGLIQLDDNMRINAIVFSDSKCASNDAIVLIKDNSLQLLKSLKNNLKRHDINLFKVYFAHTNHIAELYKASSTNTQKLDGEVSKLTDRIVSTARRDDVSDIHLLLDDTGLHITMRKDGILRAYDTVTKETGAAFLRSIFQQGRGSSGDSSFIATKLYTYGFDWDDIRLRCVNIPTEGENTLQVWRVIDKKVSSNLSIEDCGYDAATVEALAYLSELSDGLIAVAGPTNSGKSTSLQKLIAHYAKQHRQPDGTYGKKTYTLDNVIEYKIPGAEQIEVQVKANDSQEEILEKYTNYLTAILRADPDCVSMNEIRSSGEGKMLTDLVDTGRKAFVTLHAKDTFSAAKRAINEFNFNPNVFSFNGIVNAILSQKLIPTLCPHCRVPANDYLSKKKPSSQMMEFLRVYVGNHFKDVFARNISGCKHCGHTGYIGRKLVYELFIPSEINKDVCELIEAKQFYKAQELWLESHYGNAIDGVSIGQRHLDGMLKGDFCLNDTLLFVGSNMISSKSKVTSSPSGEVK